MESTRQALRERGYAAMTIEGIARACGVGKTTIYRRWPTKRQLVWQAVFSRIGTSGVPDSGSLRDDLRHVLGEMAQTLGSPEARIALPGLLTDFLHDGDFADRLRSEFIMPTAARLSKLFEQARERGELRDPAMDPLSVLAPLVGGLVFRGVISGRELDSTFVEDLCVLAMDGISTDKDNTG